MLKIQATTSSQLRRRHRQIAEPRRHRVASGISIHSMAQPPK